MNEASRGRGRPKNTKKIREGLRLTLVIEGEMYEYLQTTALLETQGNVSHLIRNLLADAVYQRKKAALTAKPIVL